MTPLERSDSALPALGRALADGLAPVPADRLARQRARVVDLAATTPRAAPRRLAWGLAGVVAVVVAAVGWKVRRPHERTLPLAAQLDGATVDRGQWIAASAAPVTLRFSDGSAVTLAVGTQLRVEDLDPRGARILVERGRAAAAIVHGPRSRWTFAAGPYVVHVTGTRFDLAWAPEQTRFDLAMREGSVTLRGPRCPEGLAVRGRDEVHAEVSANTLTLGPVVARAPAPWVPAPAQPHAPAPRAMPPSATPPLERAPAASSRTPRAIAPPLSAAHVPPATTVATAPAAPAPPSAAPPPATALSEAEAALRSGDTMRARELLLALRARFAGTPEATRAAFALGVTSQSLGAPAVAAGWFDGYLREAPDGALASEARGRRMESLRAAGDLQGARHAAEAYLLHDPDGAFAPVARGIVAP